MPINSGLNCGLFGRAWWSESARALTQEDGQGVSCNHCVLFQETLSGAFVFYVCLSHLPTVGRLPLPFLSPPRLRCWSSLCWLPQGSCYTPALPGLSLSWFHLLPKVPALLCNSPKVNCVLALYQPTSFLFPHIYFFGACTQFHSHLQQPAV